MVEMDFESYSDPLICMDTILDALKLLDYENKFVRKKGFKPATRSHFAIPAQNASEQFLYFVSLVSWLLSINNHQVQDWNKYDDPQTTSQNIILELQKLEIECDVSPSKLKTGYGEGVCQVLFKLTQMSLQNKFRFKKFIMKPDQGGDMDEEAEDVDGNDLDGGADLADMIHADQSDDDMIEEEEFGGNNAHNDLARQMEAEMAHNAIIQSGISKEKWQLEVERVAHKLKLNKNAADGREWRSHLDQTKKYASEVSKNLPDTRAKLERLQEDATRSLDKITKKEGLLSRTFQGMTGDYRAHTEQLTEIQASFSTVGKNVEDLENELTEVNDRLQNTTRKIDDTGKSFSDTKPLQNIKKSITNVKNDIKSIDIRIGVVSNTLLQLKLKERSKEIEDGKALEILDNEYEIEVV